MPATEVRPMLDKTAKPLQIVGRCEFCDRPNQALFSVRALTTGVFYRRICESCARAGGWATDSKKPRSN